MDPNAFGETENGLLVLDGLVNRYAGHHLISFGGQFSRDRLRDAQPAYDRLLDESYTNAGVFIQDDWSFASGWQLLLGARADRHSAIDELIASPRAVLMYSPDPAVNVRASMATGFRAPQAFDEDLHLSSVGGEVRIIRLDPGLTEERSINAMAGIEWRPTMGPGQGLFEVNGFYTRLTDLFNVQEHDDPSTEEVDFLKTNLGGAEVYGVELNAGWGIGDDVILQGGVVLQRSRFDEPEPDFDSRDFFRTPNRYGNLSATWNVHDVADFFFGVIYTGPMLVPHYAGFIDDDRLETSEPFWVFDAFVTRAFEWGGRGLELTAGVRNLTNAFQPDLDRGPLRDSNYVYGPRFPRSLRLGVRTSF
jgi:outer membrane receptor for ferrienterochelin and colicins